MSHFANRFNTLRILTPEGIAFNLVLASPVSRALAWAIDFACIAAAAALAQKFISTLPVPADFQVALGTIAFFAISMGYGIALEIAWRGQTLGKRFLGLRVIDDHGLRLSAGQVAVRNMLRAVDMLPGFYLVGGLAALLTRRAQRLGDLAAGTIVVRTPKVEDPDLARLLATPFNSLRDHPVACARLRQNTTADEAHAALQAVLRRDELDPDARVALFAELAAHFRPKAAFPEHADADLPDEQFIRNVADVLFRTLL